MRLAGEVESCPYMPVGADHALGPQRVEPVDEVSLFVDDCVMEVSLDLTQQWRTDLLGYVQLLLNSYPIFLYYQEGM